MANTGGSLKDEPIREIAAASITGTFQPLGSPLVHNGFRLWLTNNTNGDIYLLTDGITEIKKLPAMSGRANDDKTNDAFRIAGTQWYIKYDAVPGIPAGWFALEVEYV